MKTLYPDDIITFGKNKGSTLREIYKYQPSYLEWAILHIDNFKIDIDVFEKLPKPTPMGYRPKEFSGELSNQNLSNAGFDEILRTRGTTNAYISIEDIKKLIEEGFTKELEINYKFPERIRIINQKK